MVIDMEGCREAKAWILGVLREEGDGVEDGCCEGRRAGVEESVPGDTALGGGRFGARKALVGDG